MDAALNRQSDGPSEPRHRVRLALAFALPPLLFFAWMMVGSHTIGIDYPRFHVLSSLSMRYYSSVGVEPMWYPHLAGGIPIRENLAGLA